MRREPNQYQEMAGRVTGVDFVTIFDVGANVGQSARDYLSNFPDAKLHCFEPVQTTFDELVNVIGPKNRAVLNNFGLGHDNETALMTAKPQNAGNRVLQPGQVTRAPTQEVTIKKGDDYCGEQGIDRINFLKIDTEGQDLNVLKGFEGMLSEQRIDLVQVEASMNASNANHVGFGDFVEFFTSRNYHLFKIYGQTFEFDGRPICRRANPVFISGTAASASKGAR